MQLQFRESAAYVQLEFGESAADVQLDFVGAASIRVQLLIKCSFYTRLYGILQNYTACMYLPYLSCRPSEQRNTPPNATSSPKTTSNGTREREREGRGGGGNRVSEIVLHLKDNHGHRFRTQADPEVLLRHFQAVQTYLHWDRFPWQGPWHY